MTIEAILSELNQNLVALTAAVNRLHSSLPGSASVVAAPSAPRLEPAAVAAAETAVPTPAAPAAAPSAPSPAEQPLPSVDTVRAALVKYGQLKGRPALQELLSSYGAANLSAIKPAQFAEILAKTQAAA